MLAALLAAVLAVLASASPALAQGGNNSATAVNEQDGTTEVDIAFDVRRVMNGIVDQTNAARAYASCQECQSIAIAIQIVLVSGDVGDVVPVNSAQAINYQCDTCLAFAFAYQFVWGNGERVRFTKEARRRLRALAKAFRELERSGASADEVLAEAERLLHQLSDVLSNGVETVGRPQDSPADADQAEPASGEPPPEDGTAADGEAQDEPVPDDTSGGSGPEPSGGSSPEPTASPEGEETTEPTATPTPTATPSPTPGATVTPEPSPTAEASSAPSPSPSPSATP